MEPQRDLRKPGTENPETTPDGALRASNVPLPGVLQEIADAAGVEAALKVAQARGGAMAYFPARPKADHWLCKLLGSATALAIGRALAAGGSGVELLVPMGPDASTAERWRLIDQMIEQGCSASTIARATGCHIRTAKRHRNGHIKTRDAILAQADLFG
ncbi:MAG: hypothetical protein AAF441_18105 [Pseudomonadota bacterium]